VDVMLEAKAKDLALLWLRRQADSEVAAVEEKIGQKFDITARG